MVTDARILDLVSDLLNKGHGDLLILRRIKRAALQGEVISVNERKYVESLVEKFLNSREIIKTTSTNNPQPNSWSEKRVTLQTEMPKPIVKRHVPIRKILVVITAVVIIAAVYINADIFTQISDIEPIPELSLETDYADYNIGDIISVSGYADGDVKISVLDSEYNIVWFDEVSPDAVNRYSILIIANGDGWEKGVYTIMTSFGTESKTTNITIR
ncbi:MAG: putative membrane protein [Cenarchaeum symbiont of Oopsacas minuta]|nr:putative membrane protein [Cenarchaeum symbiont of Oopsacas minuta]